MKYFFLVSLLFFYLSANGDAPPPPPSPEQIAKFKADDLAGWNSAKCEGNDSEHVCWPSMPYGSKSENACPDFIERLELYPIVVSYYDENNDKPIYPGGEIKIFADAVIMVGPREKIKYCQQK